MMDLLGISAPLLFGQVLIGLINGLTKVFLARGGLDRDFSHHGDCAGGAPGGAVWQGYRQPFRHRYFQPAPRQHFGKRAFVAVRNGGVGVVLPFMVYPVFAMKILYLALFASAYDLIFGYDGLLAFGHAAFFGAAAVWGPPPELSILAGVAVATVIGALFGWLAIRRQGLYFAMITLALAQIVYFYVITSSCMHGEDGIQSVPRGTLFGLIDLNDTMNMYFFVLLVFLVAFAFITRLVRSPFGQVLKSVHENEGRSISLGYSTERYKLLAFTLSAMLAGLAGSVKAIVFQIASLADLNFMTSADVLPMTLIGGVGTLLGPVVSAVLVVTMQRELAFLGAWVVVVQGGAFVLCVLLLRKGVIGTLEDYLARRANRTPPK